MSFDYKKEYKEFYLPPKKPLIITVPEMKFISVKGKGDPNEEDGEYKKAVGMLYALAYTIKMSPRMGHSIPLFFDYVVPPLEGFWFQEGIMGIDYSKKSEFHWTSVIRVPEFVTKEVFDWAKEEAERKKKIDLSNVEFVSFEEGLCVQVMHVGSFDSETTTVKEMDEYALSQGYDLDFCDNRLHHEIYLSDPRKTEIDKMKTVIRHPIKEREKEI